LLGRIGGPQPIGPFGARFIGLLKDDSIAHPRSLFHESGRTNDIDGIVHRRIHFVILAAPSEQRR
jgi:hypothetical protein